MGSEVSSNNARILNNPGPYCSNQSLPSPLANHRFMSGNHEHNDCQSARLRFLTTGRVSVLPLEVLSPHPCAEIRCSLIDRSLIDRTCYPFWIYKSYTFILYYPATFCLYNSI